MRVCVGEKNGKILLFAKLNQICTAQTAHNTHRLGKGDNLSQRIKINHFRIWLISLFGQKTKKKWVDKNVNPIYHCHWWHAWLCLTSARALRFFFETENFRSEKWKVLCLKFKVILSTTRLSVSDVTRRRRRSLCSTKLSIIFLSSKPNQLNDCSAW